MKMMTMLTKEDIQEINEKSPYNQGVFFQPSMIPVHIQERAVYTRYETGGMSGGSCWGGEAEEFFKNY